MHMHRRRQIDADRQVLTDRCRRTDAETDAETGAEKGAETDAERQRHKLRNTQTIYSLKRKELFESGLFVLEFCCTTIRETAKTAESDFESHIAYCISYDVMKNH